MKCYMHYTLLTIILLSSAILSGMDRGLSQPPRLAMTDALTKKNRSCKQAVACCIPAVSTIFFAAESLHEIQETKICGLSYALCCFCALVTCDQCSKHIKSIQDKARQRKAYLAFIKKLQAQTQQKET